MILQKKIEVMRLQRIWEEDVVEEDNQSGEDNHFNYVQLL